MPIPQVLVAHKLEPELGEMLLNTLRADSRTVFLADTPAGERTAVLSNADALITWNPVKEFERAEFGLLSKVRLIQLLTAGADHLPFELLPPNAVIASNAGAFAAPMAEHNLAMALALAKRLCVNNVGLAKGDFDQVTKNRVLRGLTMGVLGYGGIGGATARMMKAALDLKVLAVNTGGHVSDPVEFAGTLNDIDHVLKNSDILLIAIPLTRRTRGLIGPRELSLMKPDAMLINPARGAIVDEEALYRHLAENPHFSAAIDAWWMEPSMDGEFKVRFPFFDLPNFLGSPHNSAIVPGIMRDVVRLAAENTARFLKGEQITGVVKPEDYI